MTNTMDCQMSAVSFKEAETAFAIAMTEGQMSSAGRLMLESDSFNDLTDEVTSLCGGRTFECFSIFSL